MPPKKNNLRYSSLGFQMAITIGLGAWGGYYLDNKYGTEKPVYTISLVLVAIAVAIYQVIRDVIRMNKENEKNQDHES